jgi:hypothetical protein
VNTLDTIHQCARCDFLFRRSSMDSIQRLVMGQTGHVYCSVDAFVLWLEARSRWERWVSAMQEQKAPPWGESILRSTATGAYMPHSTNTAGCAHDWIAAVDSFGPVGQRCRKCGATIPRTI